MSEREDRKKEDKKTVRISPAAGLPELVLECGETGRVKRSQSVFDASRGRRKHTGRKEEPSNNACGPPSTCGFCQHPLWLIPVMGRG